MANTIVTGSRYKKIQSAVAHDGNIKPGMLIELMSTGKVQRQATRGANCEILIAVEDGLQGGNLTTAYTADNVVDSIIPERGTQSQILLKLGENVVIGDKLCAAGSGLVEKKTSTYTELAVALEAKDLRASSAVDTLIEVRWL